MAFILTEDISTTVAFTNGLLLTTELSKAPGISFKGLVGDSLPLRDWCVSLDSTV